MWAVKGRGEAGVRFAAVPLGAEEGPPVTQGELGPGRKRATSGGPVENRVTQCTVPTLTEESRVPC